jgi:N-glycosylase/DNA lyase
VEPALQNTWTEWKPVSGENRFPESSLAETLDGGQAFRWKRQEDASWVGVWGCCVCRLRLDKAERLWWSAPSPIASTVGGALASYLGTAEDIRQRRNLLPWRSDPHLARCMQAFPKLRILRQPFGETLLAFLCSATKQIVQIKQMCENLATRLGREIVPGFHALPDWATVAETSEADLRSCGLGFRARYIKATAVLLNEDPDRLRLMEALPYPEARDELLRLPGVGEKVADCVLLFGAGKLEAFPVDVWILRVMENHYGLEGWSNSQIAHFGRVHFGSLAGFAQQFLFAAERRRIFV